MGTLSSNFTWRRVTRQAPCPICGKPSWCLVACDDAVALCMRISKGSARQTRRGAFVHILSSDATDGQRPRNVAHVYPRSARADLTRLSEMFKAAMTVSSLRTLGGTVGLDVRTLLYLDIGWSSGWNAWSFPMRSATGQILGIRLRRPNGRKFAVPGSHEGLFLPTQFPASNRLIVCEGPTDTAAILQLGVAAVGRPSCVGGIREVSEMVKRAAWPEVVVMGDNDEPGLRGAEALASTLRVYCPRVRLITPPLPYKDARAWVNSGVTGDVVLQRIEDSPVLHLSVASRTYGHA